MAADAVPVDAQGPSATLETVRIQTLTGEQKEMAPSGDASRLLVPRGAAQIPWDGPEMSIIEHQGHAPGHAALLIEDYRVLVAGDMLSDVLIPMLDLNGADPIDDYLAALWLLEDVADDVDVFIPGHGSIGDADQLRARIDQDRAYVHVLRDAQAHRPAHRPVGQGRVGLGGWRARVATPAAHSDVGPRR